MHPSQLLIDTVSKGMTDFDQQGAGIISMKEHHPIPSHAKLPSLSKTKTKKTGFIQRLINTTRLVFIEVIVAHKFYLR